MSESRFVVLQIVEVFSVIAWRETIPALQDLRSLIRREHGNGTNRLIGVGDDLFEQNLEMGKHAISRRGIEEVGAVLEIEPQSLGNLGGKEGQVEL